MKAKSVDSAVGTEPKNFVSVDTETDKSLKSVDSSVGTEPEDNVSVGSEAKIVFRSVKKAEDLEPTHLSLADEATYNFYVSRTLYVLKRFCNSSHHRSRQREKLSVRVSHNYFDLVSVI